MTLTEYSRSSALDLAKKFSSILALSAVEFGCEVLSLGVASGTVVLNSIDCPGATKVGNLLDEEELGVELAAAGAFLVFFSSKKERF